MALWREEAMKRRVDLLPKSSSYPRAKSSNPLDTRCLFSALENFTLCPPGSPVN